MNKEIISRRAASAAGLVLLGTFLSGCGDKAATDSTSTNGTGTVNPSLAKATPPPNFDEKGFQGQQSAAHAASEAMRKQYEGKK